MLEIQKQTLALPRPHGKEVKVVDRGDEMPGEHLSTRRSARNLKEEARNKSVIDSITQLIQQTPKLRLEGTSAAAADEQTIMVRTKNSGYGTPSKFSKGAKDANNSEKEEIEARRSPKSSKLVVTSSPMRMYEAEFLNNADDISKEQFHRDSNARISTHAGVPTSSSSPSVSPKGGKEIKWDDDNAVTNLKEEIYRERRALKSPKKSPAKSKNIPPRLAFARNVSDVKSYLTVWSLVSNLAVMLIIPLVFISVHPVVSVAGCHPSVILVAFYFS